MHKCKCKLNYFSLCALNLFKSLVLLIVMILDHIKKKTPIHNLNKLEYFIRPIIKKIVSELLAFWNVCSFTVYVLNTS